MRRKKRGFASRVCLLLFGCLICEIAAAQSTSQTALEKVAVYPSLIVFNGKIATMDKNLSFFQAMAIREETIWKLGTNQEIRELAGPNTELVDLKGHTVVPGLIESHTHPQFWVLWHLAPSYDVQLDHLFVKGDTIEQVKSRLSEAIQRRIQQAGPQKWVLVNIPWQMNPEMEKAGVNREWLDRIAPNTPVAVLTGYAGGFGNTRLVEDYKEKLGYEPSGGLRIWYDGSWGVVLRGRTEMAAEILRRELEEMVSFGITAVGTHGEVNTEVLNALRFLEQKGQLPLRFAWSHESGFFGKEPVEFYQLLGNFVGMGSDRLWNFGVGLEAWPTDPNDIQYQAQMAAVEEGLRLVDVHGNSDQVLDAIFHMMDTILGKKTRTLEQIRAMGHGFDHGNRIRPEQVPMLAKYNFWMSFQGSQFARARIRLEQQFGDERANWNAPAKSLLDAGARFTISTDAHIGSLNADYEGMVNEALVYDWPYRDSYWPWVGIWVTRELKGKVYAPEERIDRITALKATTIWAAEYLLKGDKLGSLEPGKLADFVVIDRDYFTIPEKEIMNIKTLLTAVGGKIAYKDANF